MKVQAFFDTRTSTLTYVSFDEVERMGVVIDSVLDFDPASGRTWSQSADAVADFLDQEGIRVPYVLDTHAHADHISAMPYFKERFGAKTVIGAEIIKVQSTFRDLFNLGDELPVDGSQFDILLSDGETLDVGPFEVEGLHTPGHTPACMSYRVEDCLFVGDTLFQPDFGTARCDFPGGSADELYTSIERLYKNYPDDSRIFTCHDYQPGGRDLEFESTLWEQRKFNVQLSGGTARDDFVAFRKERDGTLSMPALILPSIQLNVRAGEPPAPEENGLSYLKLPLNAFEGKSQAMSFPEVTPASAHSGLERFRIIDVREEHEFHGPLGHLEGAELIPLSTVAANAERLSGSLPLLLVCRSGGRSGKACEALQEIGVDAVTNLAGGMIGWNRAELPVQRTALKTLDELANSIVAWLAQVTASPRADGRLRMDALLLDAGTTPDEPTAAALDHALETLSNQLRDAGPPPDLELTLDAYRKDLAIL